MTDTSPHPLARQTSLRLSLAQLLPVLTVIGLTVTLAVPLAAVPFPFIDLYSNLSQADSQTWDRTIRQAFNAGIEYRPLLTLATKLAYETIGLELWVYKAVVLLQFAGILAAMLWMFQPLTGTRAIAASIAVLCVTGLHSSRILFNFNPLNAHSAVILIVLLSAAWAMSSSARRWNWVFLPVTLVAALTLESGLLLVPVLATLRLARAPGVTTGGVVAAVIGAVIYAAIHLALGASVQATAAYTHSGLGFSAATPERLDATFGRWPWLFWIYNVAATVFTVTFSEPREGTYAFSASVVRGNTPMWMWLHVVSSVVTTVLVFAAFPRRDLSPRDRLVTATALALILAGSALGFLYTRDRIALPVGIGYAMLLYVALTALLARMSQTAISRFAVVALTASLAGMWLVRDAESYWLLRDLAWEHHREWTVRYESIRNNRPVTDLMEVLRALALQGAPADPPSSPPWANRLLERKFGPSGN